jgi:hypothetical protein
MKRRVKTDETDEEDMCWWRCAGMEQPWSNAAELSGTDLPVAVQ